MGDRDRDAAASHPLEEDRRRLEDLHRRVARLELFRKIAFERRPFLCAGNYVLQLRKHLTAVADAKREGILPVEELASDGIALLAQRYPQALAAKYGELPTQPYEALVQIAEKNQLRKKGGDPDTEKAAARFLDDLRKGRLGALTLEDPSV